MRTFALGFALVLALSAASAVGQRASDIPPDNRLVIRPSVPEVMRIDSQGHAHVAPEHVKPALVPVEPNAPKIEGHPLTSVVVTQCNLIVAVYMTMRDGRLLRFDKSVAVPSDQLMTMAYSAVRSERIEVSCNETGATGYEKHDPV